MAIQKRIEISIFDSSLEFIKSFLIGLFSGNKSLYYPDTFITQGTSQVTVLNRPEGFNSAIYIDNSLSIKGFAGDSNEDPAHTLADIDIISDPEKIRVIICGEEGDDWEKAKSLAHMIIRRLWATGLSIMVYPPDLHPLADVAEDNAVNRIRRRPGRPRHADDEWAWEQVNVLGRPRSEVKLEWKTRTGVIARDLGDPDRAFRNATDPNKSPQAAKTGK